MSARVPSSTVTGGGGDLNDFAPEQPEWYNRDPHAAFRRLRAEDPVHWHEAGGFWCITRHADVLAISRDSRTFINSGPRLRLASKAGELLMREGFKGVAAERGWDADEPLDMAWPRGVISLSHVALPFPPDDPLYGRRPPDNDDVLFLGEMAMQGERGLIKLPDDWLLRLRYNPFYKVIETRVLEWFDTASNRSGIEE